MHRFDDVGDADEGVDTQARQAALRQYPA